jgi:predicted enzyme related to lactoylglutathione lyase
MHPNTEGILESSLYVSDVAHSGQFYEKIFGFQAISDFWGAWLCDASREPPGIIVVQEGRLA